MTKGHDNAGRDLWPRTGAKLATPRACQQVDHAYEPGPFDVCRRCGGEKPRTTGDLDVH